MSKLLMDDKDDYTLTSSNMNSSINYSLSPSPPSTPPAPATPEAVAPGAHLYRARLIVENHLYDELLNRYRLTTARLQEVTREASALQEENEWLQLANEDLARHLQSLLLVSDQSVGPTASSSSEQNSSNHESVGSSSPMSVVDEGDERFSLPKSISVRSPGYFKLTNLPFSSTPPSNQNGAIQHQCPKATRLRVRKEEKAIEMEVYKQGMYKTELCNKWQETGTCPYGQHCQFAHGMSELRPVIRHPRYKTQVCRMVLAGATCPYGHRCHFRHYLPPTNTSL